jgi:protein phosphatase PTC7
MLSRALRSFAQNVLHTGVSAIPAAEKAKKGTEDAFFVSERAIALADGVGGWAEHGVDPAAYSKQLMENVKLALETLPEDQRLSPKSVMRLADSQTKITGSATCVLAILDPASPWLYAGNIGDSGFYIVRSTEGKTEVVSASQDSTHGFNFPCQLGTGGDNPDKAWFAKLAVQHNDLIVMYSDGFSDNVFPSQMLKVLAPFQSLPEIPDLEVVAEMLVDKAKQQSEDRSFESPFSIAARKSNKLWEGGKPDDITVIVGRVALSS